jgi:hypothetical protein
MRIFAAVLLSLAACSPPDPIASEQRLCTDLSNALCARRARCEGGDDADAAACRAAATARCRQPVDHVQRGLRGFAPSAATTCLTRLASSECDEAEAELEATCLAAIFPAKAAEGASCRGAEDACVNSWCLVSVGPSVNASLPLTAPTCSRCRPATPSSKCDFATRPPPGLTCVNGALLEERPAGAPCDSLTSCLSGACQRGVCTELEEGASCSTSRECRSARCVSGTCAPPSGALATSCARDQECLAGLRCLTGHCRETLACTSTPQCLIALHEVCVAGACVVPAPRSLPLGHACRAAGQCAAGLACNVRCQPVVRVGESCVPQFNGEYTVSPTCPPHAACVEGTCRAVAEPVRGTKLVGESCASGDECASTQCLEHVCADGC